MAPRGRLPGLPQVAREDPGGGLLGSRPEEIDEATADTAQGKTAGSLAAVGECYCTKLFQLEETLSELTAEERYTKRLELEKPVLDALLAWANEPAPTTAPSPHWARRCTICGSSGHI